MKTDYFLLGGFRESTGVCSACVKLCHKNHEVSYAKYGNFFCDCGAKGEQSCMALNMNNIKRCSLLSTPKDIKPNEKMSEHKNMLNIFMNSYSSTGYLDKVISEANNFGSTYNSIESQLFFFDFIRVTENIWYECFQKFSYVGNFEKLKVNLQDFHTMNKVTEYDDSLFSLSSVSSEGIFDNIKMNLSGDHASLIKQLLNNNSVRRNFMACLFQSCVDKEQLLVFYDKNKLHIFSLFNFLSSQIGNKTKGSVPKLNTVAIPCIALSLVSNLLCEELLAVIGVKECHILQISKTGFLKQHM